MISTRESAVSCASARLGVRLRGMTQGIWRVWRVCIQAGEFNVGFSNAITSAGEMKEFLNLLSLMLNTSWFLSSSLSA